MSGDEDTTRVTVRSHGSQHQMLLNGQDVSKHVAGCWIDVLGRELPVVTIELSRNAEPVVFDGYSRVQVEEYNPGTAAAAFLSAMDAELLEKAALNRVDLEPGRFAVTRAVLRQLVDWANGKE